MLDAGREVVHLLLDRHAAQCRLGFFGEFWRWAYSSMSIFPFVKNRLPCFRLRNLFKEWNPGQRAVRFSGGLHLLRHLGRSPRPCCGW